MKTKILIASLCFSALSPCFADEVENQIGLGLQAYQNKDYQTSIDELQYAIASIREALNAQNALLMPEAPEGWTASEVTDSSASMAMLGGGTHMSRTYSQGDKSIELNVMSGAMASSLTMLTNPMFISGNPNMKPYRYKQYKGVLETLEYQLKATLGIAGQIMVQINGENTSKEELEAFIALINFSAIQAALLQ